jgi:hypothetical protein
MGDTIALVDWLVAEAAEKSDYAKTVLNEALARHFETHDLLTELLRSI